jgi:hypothetical protein
MLKEIFLEGKRYYYQVGRESGVTWFYKGENTKLRKEFYFFGKFIRVSIKNHSFMVYRDIENPNVSKETIQNDIHFRLNEFESKQNRLNEIKTGQII